MMLQQKLAVLPLHSICLNYTDINPQSLDLSCNYKHSQLLRILL